MRGALMVILLAALIAGRSEAAESESGSASPQTQRVTLK
jgi:tetrahydromethanopterin S-methyltransferase subunit E